MLKIDCSENNTYISKYVSYYFYYLSKAMFFHCFNGWVLSILTFSKKEISLNGLLIDDFSSGVSALGTSWEGFTDQVMGGKSELQIGRGYEDGHAFLSLSGKVSLANNGGFIQSRLGMKPGKNGTFDASRYTGLRISARGKENGYFIFLRTSGNLFPWSFFMAPLPVTEEWASIDIPWQRFKKGDFGSFFGLNLQKLTSIAVVAYKRNFLASIDVREISFY
jgi:hypothetical protein